MKFSGKVGNGPLNIEQND